MRASMMARRVAHAVLTLAETVGANERGHQSHAGDGGLEVSQQDRTTKLAAVLIAPPLSFGNP